LTVGYGFINVGDDDNAFSTEHRSVAVALSCRRRHGG
jgi:hypothetical protein